MLPFEYDLSPRDSCIGSLLLALVLQEVVVPWGGGAFGKVIRGKPWEGINAVLLGLPLVIIRVGNDEITPYSWLLLHIAASLFTSLSLRCLSYHIPLFTYFTFFSGCQKSFHEDESSALLYLELLWPFLEIKVNYKYKLSDKGNIVYTIEYYSAKTKNEILTLATKWME